MSVSASTHDSQGPRFVESTAVVEARPSLVWTCAALFVLGFVARVAPLFDVGGRLFKQFPTEDGYLMLTIARNLALGRGMSTAEGTIPTNGTQPLFNFIEALGFVLSDGDRQGGVAWALGCEIVIACGAAYGLFRLVKATLRARPRLASRAAWLTSAAWFVSPVAVPHTMNCLESGLYVMACIYSLWAWQALWRRRTAKTAWAGALQVGALLGLTFWARIDAVFLIAAVTVSHVALEVLGNRSGANRDGSEPQSGLRPRLNEALVMGSVSVAVAAPWLLNNLLRFGSLMPISGTAQSKSAHFGMNLVEVPSKLVEYATVVLPIPHTLERVPSFLFVEAALAVAYLGAIGFFVLRRLEREERGIALVLAIFSSLLVGYYGLTFGAGHFVGRYLFPLSIPFSLLTCAGAVALFDSAPGWAKKGALAAAAALVLMIGGLHARVYDNGDQHQHFQVVTYVREHVPDAVWVGAIQTGTLGFFHDRTINLDGKVNPDALSAALERKVPNYVVDARFGSERRPIEWLVDWIGIAGWIELEPISSHFDLVVDDRRANLAALRRRGTVALRSTP